MQWKETERNFMKTRKKIKWIRVFLLGVFFLCLILIGRTYYLSYQHERQQKKLREIKYQMQKETLEKDTRNQETTVSKTENTENKQQEQNQEKESKPVILSKYASLYKENNHLAGWLSIKGMAIDYPVMQCQDDEYYLNHDFYRKKSKYGCLYVRGKADVNTPGTNFIIYGHNMKDGEMFGDLDLYQDESFYREHSKISFDTLYEERIYEIIAVFPSQVYNSNDDVFKYYQFYQANTKKEFDEFYNNIKKLSLYDTEVNAKFGDTFLTLSTCAYHVEDGRFVIVAKKIK